MEDHNEVLEFDLDHNKSGERTSTLKVSAVLSWIMAGLMILICSIFLLAKGAIENAVEQPSEELTPELLNSLELLLFNFDNIFLSNLIFYTISVVAVILMYKLKKIGFYLYVIIHLLIIAFPYTYQPFVLDTGTVFGFLVFGLFVALYGSNLKHMK
jgi:hypothetical protein